MCECGANSYFVTFLLVSFLVLHNSNGFFSINANEEDEKEKPEGRAQGEIMR